MRYEITQSILREAGEKGAKTIGEAKKIAKEIMKDRYGTVSTNKNHCHDVSTREKADKAARHMVEIGDYPLIAFSNPEGSGGCFTVGINGGCGHDCYVFQGGNCENYEELLEGAPQELIELYE